jgi:hypothetical protein
MMMSQKKIIARFQPQAWINDYGVDIDGAVDFDVTETILAMTKEKALTLRDGQYETDALALDAGLLANISGPFRVEVELAIQNYFDAIEEHAAAGQPGLTE